MFFAPRKVLEVQGVRVGREAWNKVRLTVVVERRPAISAAIDHYSRSEPGTDLGNEHRRPEVRKLLHDGERCRDAGDQPL